MEAIAAFSLACNVIQVVDTGIKVASKACELHRDGTTGENEEIQRTTQHLVQASTSLQQSMINANDKELETVANECQSAADELLVKLDNLKLGGIHKKRKLRAIGKAVKSMTEKDAIKQSQTRLEECRKALDSGVLVHLW